MSDRYKDYKGSSRSARDDSRAYKERRRSRSRSRSRSPDRPAPPSPGKSRRSYEKSRAEPKHYDEQIRASDNWEDSDEEVPAPPPPPRITKISIDFQKPKAPIKMSLGGSSKASAPAAPTVASVFNAEDDDEPEEMPAEARMRMRNIGRETPTSAGPNSFGKTKQGFCDAKKVFEKNLKNALDTVDKPTLAKLPQTIYRINPGGP